jgi:hypothetical protein
MNRLAADTLKLKGKTCQDLFSAMKKKGMNIGDVVLRSTSPWDRRSRGHTYIRTVILYETDTYDLSNGEEIRTIEVKLKEKVDFQEFLRQYEDNMVTGLKPYHIASYRFACRIKNWKEMHSY